MGIESFFSSFTRNFNIINQFYDTNYDIILDAEYIFLDFNSIIYTIIAKLTNELIDKNTLSFDDINKLIFKNINEYLINLFKRFNLSKLKTIYICLDGTPSFSKMLEQKKRGYISDFIDNILNKYNVENNSNILNWNKSNIKPGTIFMNQLNKFLLDFKYENIKIIVSTSDKSGEAEMKIVDYINTFKELKNKIYFFSPDSDVILLSLISSNSDYINVIKHDKNIISIIDTKLLKSTIYNYCKIRIDIDLDLQKLINDIVFIFTIFGNDFLPKCESINVRYDILLLIDIYLINLNKLGYILNETNIINECLYNFFELLSKHERRLIFRNVFNNLYNNFNKINQLNFLADLNKFKHLSLKKNTNYLSGNIFGKPFYNFYNNILLFIDPLKLNIKYLDFYIIHKNQLFTILHEALQTEYPINQLIIIDLKKINIEDIEYQTINRVKYISQLPRHQTVLVNLNNRDKEEYLINNKLDKYTQIFNPINNFYLKTIKMKDIDKDYFYYYYFHNNKEKIIIEEYLKGLKWVYQYYYLRKDIDEFWYYPYNKVPLFETIITFYSPQCITTNFISNKLNINPIEQLLYVTPINYNNLNNLTNLIDDKHLDKIILFIQNNKDLYYDLNTIYNNNQYNNLFDCSHAMFISKCDYKLLDNIIDINLFIEKCRIYF
uniref:Xrn1 N-terminal domain-containing protein n=1 Tax=viral metagenome TaxID=1070528 RepID=A0A6C0H824_9ZZZZ